jgi:RHS repeat-associated protein
VVATFDPTLLQNDIYDLRLTATDFSGNAAAEEIFFSVEGQAKLGNYAVEFTDLSIPLAGIPITITRQYDTLNANESGDFGYGWKLDIGEGRIRETVPVTSAELAGVPSLFGGATPFFDGARVYVTTPEGQRVGFTFRPEATIPGLLQVGFAPKFVADVDTNYELEVPEIPLTQNADGTFGLYLFGGNYNPREYTLVSTDQMRYTYDQFDGLQTVEDRNGVTLEYREDGIFSSTGESIDFVRDDQGRITEIVDPAGNSIYYEYDAAGDLVKQTSLADCGCSGGAASLLESTITYSASQPHFLETITGPRGNLINEIKYDDDGRFVGLVDALGNEVVQEFDVANNSFVQTDRNGNPTTLEYDDRGNVTKVTDALGGETISAYDDARHIHLETSITDANGNTTYYTYDDAGNVTLLEEPGGVFTRFEYDGFNNVTKTIGQFLAGEEATARVTEFVYDTDGNLAETIDALGNSSFQTNDEYGRPLTITDRRGNTTTLEYAQLIGSPTRVINPDLTEQNFTYDSLGRPLTQTNELGVVVQTIVYDGLGRQLSVTGADGQLTTYEYDFDLLMSETVTINATESQVTSYEYDDNNRLFLQTDGIGAVVELTYDANGNVLSLTDPVGNETSYVFDALNRQIQETDPLSQITTYVYDAVGNLTEKTDRLGRRIEFVYDVLDRQTAELWYAVDGTLIETSSYTYDIFDNLLTADDAESSYTYTYDVLDRLITSDNAGTPDTPNVILTYAYDVDGNRIQVADNSGVTIDSDYGTRNQLLSKAWHGGEVDDARIEYDFDAALREIEARRYSDVTGTNQIGSTETVYDDTGRRVRITHLDGSDVVLANYEYEFDQANRITQQTIDNDVVDYGYDATGQLLTADHFDPTIPDEFYVYDLNGNRIESHLHGTNHVTGPNNQLLSDGEFNYEFDNEGNQVRRTNIATGEVTEYEYDHRNRLTKTTVKTSGGIITGESQYIFDLFGRRIAVINDADGAGPGAAIRENIAYDGDNAWADYTEAGEAIARYIFGDGTDDNIARWRAGQGNAWYLTDHLGTVRGVADAVGMLVNQTTYDSFGQVLNETNSIFGDRFKFTGRELSSGSDYYYRARTYNASQGRFSSLDGLRFNAGDGNLYRYVINSALNYSDPSGNSVVVEWLIANAPRLAITGSAGYLGCLIGDGIETKINKGSDDGPELIGLVLSGEIYGSDNAAEIAVRGGVFGVLSFAINNVVVGAGGSLTTAGAVAAAPALVIGIVVCASI